MKYQEITDTPSFCVLPWLSLVVLPSGTITYCCISHQRLKNTNGTYIETRNTSLQEAWSSQPLRDIRKRVLNGALPKSCNSCKASEKNGIKSYRQIYNDEWTKRIGIKAITELVNNSQRDDYKVANEPMYLDLRLGNKCNLKCRMCNPHNSSSIHNEWQEIDNNDPSLTNLMAKYNLHNKVSQSWTDCNELWKGLKEAILHTKKLYLTGGEPTIIDANYKILEECIATDRARHIDLMFNLNMTNLPNKFLKLIRHFKTVNIAISIDGTKEVNEYIRYGSSWEIVNRNIDKLLQLNFTNLIITFTPVIQIYNANLVHKLTEYIAIKQLKSDVQITLSLILCHAPIFLSTAIIPKRTKMKIIILLLIHSLKLLPIVFINPRAIQLFLEIKRYILFLLSSATNAQQEELIQDFFSYTAILDKKRRHSFSKTNKKLCKDLQKFIRI